MATIVSKEIIAKIIEGDGYYLGDPRIFKIVKYTDMSGGVAFGLTWEHEDEVMRHRYERATANVRYPEIIWQANNDKQ